MGERIATATAASALIGLLVALGTQQAQATPANKCLSAPNGPSPNGQHWHYHLDRAKNRKCWYLRAIDATQERAVGSPVDTKKAQAELTDSVRMLGSAVGESAYAGAAVPAIQMNAPDLPRSAEPSGLSVPAEDNQPPTAAVPEAPQQPAPQLPQADAEAKTGSAAGAAISANKELVGQYVQSPEPPVPSTTSRSTVTGTAIVIVAASVLAALAVFILMLARRRRRAMQHVPLPDQAAIIQVQVATAGVLSEESARLAEADFSYSADSNSEPISPESGTPVARDIVAKLMTDWVRRGLSPLGLAEAFVDAGLLQITRERGPRAAAAILQEFTGSGPRIDCT
jgi:hypothetical protein